jgi:hypothetical protein
MQGVHDDIPDIMECTAVHPFADERSEFRAEDFNRHERRFLIP